MLSLPQFSNMVVHNALLIETVLPAIAKVQQWCVKLFSSFTYLCTYVSINISETTCAL